MLFDEAEIFHLIQSLWEEMLELPVESSPEPEFPFPSVSASIEISGNWNGVVAVACQRSLAERVAAKLFSTSVDQLDETQIRDAVGELTNIIGGNIKSMLPGPCKLGLPVVAEATFTGSHSESACVFDAGYRSVGLPLRVTVHQTSN